MEREEVETEMNFLGFIIFENRLKDATKPTLTELKNADITSLMVTGDNILTAISVARASGLISENATVFYPELSAGCQFINHNNVRWKCIDEVVSEFDSLNLRPVSSTDDEFELVLAVTGDFFNFVVDLAEIKTDDFETDEFSKNYLQDLMKKCSIYARMSPNQKQLLVEILQNQDRIVGFCGDGANDCGALKASNVGISLSQAEASVAAPFTSQIQDISCVPMLLKEGRASLVTSLCCFKFISLYGMIQFSSLIFIYTIPGSFSNGQFCVLDILLIVPLGSLITLYGPAEHLSKKQPEAKLVSPKMLTNVIGHIFLQLAFQFLAFKGFTYYSPSAFTEFDPDEDDTHHPTITGQFLYSSFIYIASAIVFSVGRPFRQAVYWPLYFYAIFVTFLMIFMTFFSSSIKFLANMMNFVDVDYHKSDWFYRRVGIVVFALLYFVTAFFMDRIIFNRLGRALEFAFSKNRVTRKS